MTDNDKMREAFERDHGPLSDDKDMQKYFARHECAMRWAWQAAQSERKDKPAECVNGCPANQVCDYCQSVAAIMPCDASVTNVYEAYDAGKKAAQSVPADEDSVISIASAYESGIGHCNDNLCNPYKVGSAESFAYDYGKEFGKARGIEKSVPVVGEALYWIDPDDDANIVRTRRVGWSPLYGQPTHSITQAELERLRKDAERYRWLRDGNDHKTGNAVRIATKCYGLEWDAEIDDAIAAEGSSNG